MERLTKRMDEGILIRSMDGQEKEREDIIWDAVAKLADYEDSGLSPEEVEQLKEDYAELEDEYDWLNEMKEITTWED